MIRSCSALIGAEVVISWTKFGNGGPSINIVHYESYQVDLELKIIALYMLSLLQAWTGLRSNI